MVNVRAETLLEKPSFKQLVATLPCSRRRILCVAQGGQPQRADVNSTIGDEGVVKSFS
jgi:putative SOS response-associated peptidase YedK